jgi:hypothetical protein
VLRIRLVTLTNNEGWVIWRSAPVPRSGDVALGFSAYSGIRGRGELSADGRPLLEFPLDAGHDFDLSAAPYRLCYRAEASRGGRFHGSYFLIGPAAEEGEAVTLEVRFRSGMSAERMQFTIDRRRSPEQLTEAYRRCRPPPDVPLVDGADRLLDAAHNAYPSDTGRWRVAEVF